MRYVPRKSSRLIEEDTTVFDGSPVNAVCSLEELWVSLTQRKCVLSEENMRQLSLDVDRIGITEAMMLAVSAAYIPRLGDVDDFLRLHLVLAEPYIRKIAEEVQSSANFPKREYEYVIDDRVSALFPNPPDSSSDIVLRYIVASSSQFQEDEINDLVDAYHSLVHTSSGSLYPPTSKGNRATKDNFSRKTSFSSRNKSYFSGSLTSGVVTGDSVDELMRVDDEAMLLLKDGVELSVVQKFHELAPDGYWEKVSEMAEDNKNDELIDIYDSLETIYNFHPYMRDAPQ